jgi:hypothetical protein
VLVPVIAVVALGCVLWLRHGRATGAGASAAQAREEVAG